jgi:hypothetical protein
VKYEYFRKILSLEAAGSGFNLGFNYSHLEKQDKESLTEVVIRGGLESKSLCDGSKGLYDIPYKKFKRSPKFLQKAPF